MPTCKFRYELVKDGDEIELDDGEQIIDTEMVDPGTLGVWTVRSVIRRVSADVDITVKDDVVPSYDDEDSDRSE